MELAENVPLFTTPLILFLNGYYFLYINPTYENVTKFRKLFVSDAKNWTEQKIKNVILMLKVSDCIICC